MSQVTIYLEDSLARELRERAADQGVSQSQWIARLIEAELKASWPEPVKQLAGAWPDFPELEALRHPQGQDVSREPF